MTEGVEYRDLAREFGLHDGLLSGIVVSQERDCVLFMRSVAGEKFELQLVGVRMLKVDEFREGNIIFDILVFPPESARPDELAALVAGETHPNRGALVSQEKERMSVNKEVLVTISSSYRCSLLAICREAKVRRT